MKVFNIFLMVFLLFNACKMDKTKDNMVENPGLEKTYASYGDFITPQGSFEGQEILTFLEKLSPTDSTPVKIKAQVKEVCKAKGCWMTLVLPGEINTRVVFKDYGFFVPKDIEGKTVIIDGKAFAKLSSVDDQQHYARDAGLDEEDIESITETKEVYGFEARGVLIER